MNIEAGPVFELQSQSMYGLLVGTVKQIALVCHCKQSLQVHALRLKNKLNHFSIYLT